MRRPQLSEESGMLDGTIKIRIIGSDADEGDVRLSDFIEQLNAVRDALRETQHALYGRDAPEVEFRIVDLSHASPSTIYMRPIGTRAQRIRAARIGGALVVGLAAVAAGKKPPPHTDLATLEAYREIARPLHRHIQRIELETEKKRVASIDRSFQETVDELIGPDVRMPGSVTGFLERVNLHNAHKFDIFPAVGPRRVRCSFDEALLEKVRSGLKRHVTVCGSLRYKTWDKFPYAIDARKIDVHEADSELPSIYDLHGIAPDATGELSSEHFVRMIRETNW
jgi:hypothetical protein